MTNYDLNTDKPLVFISIPKTGSTSISQTLKELDPKGMKSDQENVLTHRTAKSLRKFYNESLGGWDSYYKFAFVRNPFDVLVSIYFFEKYSLEKPLMKKYLKETKEEDIDRKLKMIIERHESSTSFDDHIKKWYRTMAYPNQSPFQWGQCQFIMDYDKMPLKNVSDDMLIVDYVGRFENLQNVFVYCCEQVGLPTKKLSHKKQTEHDNYREYYTEESKNIVRKSLHHELEYFGYDF